MTIKIGEYVAFGFGVGSTQDCNTMGDVKGKEKTKMELARAVSNVILLIGKPGAGKTMFARRLHEYMPDLPEHAKEQITETYRDIMRNPKLKKVEQRPFRAPHHTVGAAGMSGECELAQHGVLFLDEAPEFSKHVLGDGIREASQSGNTTVVVATNPCPCGGHRGCQCSQESIERYLDRVSETVTGPRVVIKV